MNNNNQKKTYPQIPLYNPDNEDFEVTYDLNEDGVGEPFLLPAEQITEFPEPVANHIKKHLAEKLLFKWGWKGSNADDKRQEIFKRITVTYE